MEKGEGDVTEPNRVLEWSGWKEGKYRVLHCTNRRIPSGKQGRA